MTPVKHVCWDDHGCFLGTAGPLHVGLQNLKGSAACSSPDSTSACTDRRLHVHVSWGADLGRTAMERGQFTRCTAEGGLRGWRSEWRMGSRSQL